MKSRHTGHSRLHGLYRISAVWLFASIASIGVTSIPAIAANGNVTYTYDALGRLTSASYDTGVIIYYNYDANGNRTQQVVNVNTGAMCWGAVSGTCVTATWGAGLWHS